MKEKFKDFITDYYRVGMVILDLLLLVSMPFNPNGEWTHFRYFSLVSRIAFPFIVFLFGGKGIWIFYYFTSIIHALDITFDDFTALSAFVVLFLFVNPKHKWLKITTVVTYLICVFCVATMHNKQPYHLFVHFIGCCILCLTVYKLVYNKNIILKKEKEEAKKEEIKKLDLTYDEMLILDELIKGKKQKEIALFSENTVSDKLKQARLRNNLKDTDELIIKYKLM